MADPARPKRKVNVTAQIPISPAANSPSQSSVASSPAANSPSQSSVASSSAPFARPRARIDPSNISSPAERPPLRATTSAIERPSSRTSNAAQGSLRPTLRAAVSSSSLRAAATSSSGFGSGSSRARASSPPPVPPLPRARVTAGLAPSSSASSQTSSGRSSATTIQGQNGGTPVARVRAAPTANASGFKTPTTPIGGPSGTGSAPRPSRSPVTPSWVHGSAANGGTAMLRRGSSGLGDGSVVSTSSQGRPSSRLSDARVSPSPSLAPIAARSRTFSNDVAHARSNGGPHTPSSPIPPPLLSPASLHPALRSPTPSHQADARGDGFALDRSISHPIPDNGPHTPIRPTETVPSTPAVLRARLADLHPTSSAPPTPRLASGPFEADQPTHAGLKIQPRIRAMPFNPYTNVPLPLPAPPISPELRTVSLPPVTPGRSSDEWSRGSGEGSRPPSQSGSDVSAAVVALVNNLNLSTSTAGSSTAPRRQSLLREDVSASIAPYEGELSFLEGTTAAESPAALDGNDPKLMVSLQADSLHDSEVKEARIDRKVADLEISNASLMAINRSLEATKKKQRTEIVKLRRLLRESLTGGPPGQAPPGGGGPLLSPGLGADDMDEEDSFYEELMHDAEAERRWVKLNDLVGNMLRRGRDAVERGEEEVKVVGRVLGWDEVHEGEGDGDLDGADARHDRDVSVPLSLEGSLVLDREDGEEVRD